MKGEQQGSWGMSGVFFFLLASLLLASAGYAAQADRDKPVHLRADEVTIDQQKGTAVYTGNVVLSQGSLKITASKMVMVRKGDQMGTMNAYGSPAHLAEVLDDGTKVAGEAKRIEYDMGAKTVNLYEDAWVQRGTDEMRGEVISYNTENGFAHIKGTPQGQVEMIFSPKSFTQEKKQGQEKAK